MKYSEIARSMDSDLLVVEAAWAYELALLQEPENLQLRLDLVALYVVANDFGFAAANRLDQRFIDVAHPRAVDLLEEGFGIHGEHPELHAWLHHLNERVLGEPIPDDTLRSLADDPRGEFARLLLYVASNHQEHRLSVEAVFQRAAAEETTRQRHYFSYVPQEFFDATRRHFKSRQHPDASGSVG